MDYHSFSYEQKEQALIKSLIKPGQIVFDIGAHIGDYTKLLSQIVGSGGKVYAFEPTKKIFNKLISNTSYTNVTHINKAVYSKNDLSCFFEFELGYEEFNSLKNPQTEHQPIIITTVETITLNTFCNQNKINRIDYLKLDAEGAEFDILKGANELLSKNQIKYIQFEISKAFIVSFNISTKRIFEYLLQYDYKSHIINDDSTIGEIVNDTTKYKDNFIAFKE